ncbi:MAG TPA: 2,3-diphosphoglycerate synthetase, partial [Actinomycetota bacterium]|nr:2,3-diphosphoglycerate synthetase [Actinomycetota bacterium]
LRSQPRSIVLIDGEHYPPVVARALKRMREQGEKPLVALMVGGGEKLGQMDTDLGVPVEDGSKDPEAALLSAIERHGATRVIDLSDDPVLGYVNRSRLASIALFKDAEYIGADFSFTPPTRPDVGYPSVGIIGTGKRTGKTAIGGTVARLFKEGGLRPVVVAMGRGGPEEPEVIEADAQLDAAHLADLIEQGKHASSDYIEDALTAGVPTVGAWRAGGGMAGATSFSNYEKALEAAGSLDPGILVLEGSGAAIPPARWDAGILIVDAGIPVSEISGYFGLYKLLLADLVVLTMVEESLSREHLAAVERCLRSGPLSQPRVVRTTFRPHPLSDITGKRVWFATTAPQSAGDILKEHLEKHHQAEVINISHSLSNRDQLRADLKLAAEAEVLLVELKAAAVDVVVRKGLEAGSEVVFVDNRPQSVDGVDLDSAFLEVGTLATDRFTR